MEGRFLKLEFCFQNISNNTKKYSMSLNQRGNIVTHSMRFLGIRPASKLNVKVMNFHKMITVFIGFQQ